MLNLDHKVHYIFVLHPGEITSTADKQSHFVSGSELVKLYGLSSIVSFAYCGFWIRGEGFKGWMPAVGEFIGLHPQQSDLEYQIGREEIQKYLVDRKVFMDALVRATLFEKSILADNVAHHTSLEEFISYTYK